MDSIDRKYKILAVNRGKGTTHTDKDALLFLAKDNAVPATLKFYYEECARQGCDSGHLESVRLLIERVHTYRTEHPELCKKPDMSSREEAIQIKGQFARD